MYKDILLLEDSSGAIKKKITKKVKKGQICPMTIFFAMFTGEKLKA